MGCGIGGRWRECMKRSLSGGGRCVEGRVWCECRCAGKGGCNGNDVKELKFHVVRVVV